MKIYIELIIFLILIMIFFSWKYWYKLSTRKLLKQYSLKEGSAVEINDDTKQKGGIFKTRRTERADKGTNTISFNNIRHDQPEGRGVLPKADVNDVGADSSSTREDSIGTRKNVSTIRERFFRRRNKKK